MKPKKHHHKKCCCPQPCPIGGHTATHFAVTIGTPVLKKEKTMALKVSISTEEKAMVIFTPSSAAGNEVKDDEPVTFAVTTGTVTLDPQADGVSAFIVSGAAPETGSVVTVTDKSGKLTDTVTVDVTGVVATHFAETALAPVAKTAPTPTPAPTV